MKRIKNNQKLTLHRESLRTLIPAQLAHVAGGTGRFCFLADPPIQVDPTGFPSLNGLCPSEWTSFVSEVIQPGG